MAAPHPMYLLDTNILVLLIRDKDAGRGIAANFGLRRGLHHCTISVVTVGEMYALAKKLDWEAAKINRIAELLEEVIWVDIDDPAILRAYGELDDFSYRLGHEMGKNDLWIAATVKVSGLTLLTTDGDFDHLHSAEITRIRIDDKTGNPLP